MKNIVLVCSLGMSTSMLVEKMRESAKQTDVEVNIKAISENDLHSKMDIDIAMLGPQISHLEDSIKEKLTVPVVTIDMTDYGMMDGEKVLNRALKEIE